MSRELLRQELSSLLWGAGQLEPVEKGSREREGARESGGEKPGEKAQGEGMSQQGNEDSSQSTANVIIISIREDRTEGRVGVEKTPPSLLLPCNVASAPSPGLRLPFAGTVGTFRCCHTLSTLHGGRPALLWEALFPPAQCHCRPCYSPTSHSMPPTCLCSSLRLRSHPE